ncbi:MAG: DUF6411 family protein [Actinomycetota bacterium]|nr:DUF6411 family protein [Actinomycetota bacterium]
MKVLLLVGLLAVVCVVLFVTGIISPKRSRTMQRSVDRLARKGERKGDRNAGRLGNLSRSGLAAMRRAANRSGRRGRKIHEQLTSNR